MSQPARRRSGTYLVVGHSARTDDGGARKRPLLDVREDARSRGPTVRKGLHGRVEHSEGEIAHSSFAPPASFAQTMAVRVRVNRRALQSRNTVASLIELYHLTPTFAPLEPAKLAPVIVDAFFSRQLPTAVPLTTSIKNTRLMGPSAMHTAQNDAGPRYSDMSFEPAKSMSTHAAFVSGQEPPLEKRLRLVVDALHGTAYGGLAGEYTLQEKAGLFADLEEERTIAAERAEAQERAAERTRQAEQDEEDEFDGAFDEDESRR